MKRPNIVEFKVGIDAGEWDSHSMFRACTLPDTDTYLVVLRRKDVDNLIEDWFVVSDRDAMLSVLIGFMYGDSHGEECRESAPAIAYGSDYITFIGFSNEDEVEFTDFNPMDLEETMLVLGLEEGWVDAVGGYIAKIKCILGEKE